MKGKQLLYILLYYIIYLILQSQMIQFHDQINGVDSQLSQRFDEVLANQQEPSSKDKLHELDDISILTQELSDHQLKDLTTM